MWLFYSFNEKKLIDRIFMTWFNNTIVDIEITRVHKTIFKLAWKKFDNSKPLYYLLFPLPVFIH